jgi:DNA-binding PadR family transcriptional regulator
MFNPTTTQPGRRHRHDQRHGPDRGPFGFGRGFGGRGQRAMIRRGEIRPLILATLATRPMHGYEVIQELEAQSGGRWRPSAGSVYPTLQQLTDEGLLTSQETDGRRVYTLTDAGKAAAASAPTFGWPDSRDGRGNDVRHLGRQVAEAAMQVQRVGSREAVIATEQILLDTRARLYGLLAADSGTQPGDASGPQPGVGPSDASDQ